MTTFPLSSSRMEEIEARADASATSQARAIALRSHGMHVERLLAQAGRADGDLIDVLLDLCAVARIPLAPDHPDLVHCVHKIRYGTAANLVLRPAPAGGTYVISVAALLRDLSQRGERLPSDARLVGDPADALLEKLTAQEPSSTQRGVPSSKGRLLFGPTPFAVLSTAGEPVSVAAALSSHLSGWQDYGYRDVRLLVADDASGPRADRLAEVLASLSQRFPETHMTRYAEESVSGEPGSKAAVRAEVRRQVPDELAEDVDRVFAANAPGSANAVFALLAGEPLLWLEQDSTPQVLHARPGRIRARPSCVRLEDVVDFTGDRDEVNGICSTPVDVRHVMDRLLYGPSEYPLFDRAEHTYEDSGMERVGRFLGWGGRAVACHFHITGHPDFRARLSHNALTMSVVAPEGASRLLEGVLDRTRLLVMPPEPAVVESATTTFGTAVGFSNALPLPAPCMAATKVRLFDFSVAALLAAAGTYHVAWAATALTHERSLHTTSGRGSLAPYVKNEDLLWPLFHAIVSLLSKAPRRLGEDASAWLERIGRFIEHEAAVWNPSARESRRTWLEGRADALASGLPDSVERYIRELCSDETDWLLVHRQMRDRVRLELRRYGRQLRIWSVVVDPRVTRRLREKVPAVLERLQ